MGNIQKHPYSMFSNAFLHHLNLEIQIKLPEIPLDMSVCDGCDNEDLGVKQESMDRDKVKSEQSPPGLKPEDPCSASQDVLTDAQLQTVTDSGNLYVIGWGT